MDLHEIYRRIFRGGMPALYADDAPERDRFFASYVQSYLERDIRDLTQVVDEPFITSSPLLPRAGQGQWCMKRLPGKLA